jgi:hypothetical protein
MNLRRDKPRRFERSPCNSDFIVIPPVSAGCKDSLDAAESDYLAAAANEEY